MVTVYANTNWCVDGDDSSARYRGSTSTVTPFVVAFDMVSSPLYHAATTQEDRTRHQAGRDRDHVPEQVHPAPRRLLLRRFLVRIRLARPHRPLHPAPQPDEQPALLLLGRLAALSPHTRVVARRRRRALKDKTATPMSGGRARRSSK